MKNNLKKCLALLLSVVMVLAMATTVLAASNNTTGGRTNVAIAENAPETGTLTISNRTEDANYKVYKVFSASVDEGDNTYTWTAETAFATALGGKTAEDIANLDATDLKALAASLAAATTAEDSTITEYDGELTALALGYYLVVESGTDGLNKSQPILVAVPQVQDDAWVYDITVSPKSSTTDFKKKIAEGSNLVDTNTKNIGDYIDYRLWADIPTYSEASYTQDNLTFAITDTMSSQLTWGTESTVSVYVIDTYDEATVAQITSGTVSAIAAADNYSLTPESITDTFTVDFTNNFLKTYAGKVVVIAFKAQLNDTAIIADAEGADLSGSLGADETWRDQDYNKKGNPNAAKLVFTNEFDVTSDSDTDEIDDIVTTFTFELNVEKIDKARTEGKKVTLAGAEFEVYTDAECKNLYTNSWKAEGAKNTFDGKLTTDEDGTVTANGFKDGTYYIKETKAPAGYKLFDGVITVVINALKDKTDTTQYSGEYNYTITMAETPVTGTPTVVTVEDEKGVTLPGTGGIGTTLFTFGGLALVILAAVLFIVYTKKQRKQA